MNNNPYTFKTYQSKSAHLHNIIIIYFDIKYINIKTFHTTKQSTCLTENESNKKSFSFLVNQNTNSYPCQKNYNQLSPVSSYEKLSDPKTKNNSSVTDEEFKNKVNTNLVDTFY